MSRTTLLTGAGAASVLALATGVHGGLVLTPDTVQAETNGLVGDVSARFAWESAGNGVVLDGDTGTLRHSLFGTGFDVDAVGEINGTVEPGDFLEITYEIFTDFNFGTMTLLQFEATGNTFEIARGAHDVDGEAIEVGSTLNAFESVNGSFQTSAFSNSGFNGGFALRLAFGFAPNSAAAQPLTDFFALVELRSITVRVVPAPGSLAMLGLIAGVPARRRR